MIKILRIIFYIAILFTNVFSISSAFEFLNSFSTLSIHIYIIKFTKSNFFFFLTIFLIYYNLFLRLIITGVFKFKLNNFLNTFSNINNKFTKVNTVF